MPIPIYLHGIDQTIEVVRDRWGIPHIRASTIHDAFFGQGFITAQDRLFHMDHDRLIAYGRWAEYAGEAALQEDIQRRRFQILTSVRRDYEHLNTDSKSMVDAYAKGVNAFIQTTESLPLEYGLLKTEPEPWQPWDCLAVFKGRHMLMGVFEAKLWRQKLIDLLGMDQASRLLPGYEKGHLLIVPPNSEYKGSTLNVQDSLSSPDTATIEDGSNNWAVSGSRTASGKPLLAGDPHRSLDTPNVYYQNHIVCPEFDAIGLSFPGCPGFPHIGHNTHVAWCITHAQADYQDLYIERFKKDTPDIYEYKGSWLQADMQRETMKVRGGKIVHLDVTVTKHGPIIVGEPKSGRAISLKYTGIDGPNPTFECLPRMLQAASAREIDTAMTNWVDPCNNFVFADVNGNIGYLMRGRLPIRHMSNAWTPVPAWIAENEWNGYVPFKDLPRSINPSTGYIVTANNKIVNDAYPYYIALDFAPDYRARRITTRLKELSKSSVEDMASILSDTVSIPGQTYVELLRGIKVNSKLASRARDILIRWDGSMDQNAVAPTIYSAFRHYLDTFILSDLLGPLAKESFSATGRGAPVQLRQLKSLLVTMARKDNGSLLPQGTNWGSIMAKALEDAVSYLQNRLGDKVESWEWGCLHLTKPHHPLSDSFPKQASLLDPPSTSLSGDGDTPLASSYASNSTFEVTGTSVARYVFDTADWDNSRWIVPLGASGHPKSPHYADQTTFWAHNKLIPMLFSWHNIVANAESHQELKNGMGEI